jgi:hypothetical protein
MQKTDGLAKKKWLDETSPGEGMQLDWCLLVLHSMYTKASLDGAAVDLSSWPQNVVIMLKEMQEARIE